MMKNQSGFTLIEMLLVFSVFLVIVSVSAILLRPQYLLFEKERFYSQFKADLLYSQQYAISQQKSLVVYILPKENRYFVKEKLSSKYIVDRDISDMVTVENGTLGTSSINFDFTPSGGMNRFGTVYFIVGGQRYKITFQIGVGRFYVVKE
ncbi:type II secretion system protein [Bacillus sp. V3B]|uniref:competence type IV pilus minor pilin ComGD n=1 Tax=Bacillus sp. V3B TaxID=2804915 RepID=UPI00210A322E|nr:competence type IV pilus minor pilin ComGD [Bacillus sp. V3B]MCQ6273716.1 type II secretion system protein [Bacillus sp. V3B]